MKRLHKRKGFLWLGCLVLIMVLGFAAMTCTASATPVSSNGKLSVKGTKIVNAKGKTFQIKGVSTHGLAWYPQYVSKAAFKDLRDKWGANTVRLAMYTAEYGGYCSGGDRTALKAKIDEGVKAATELGMYVIIDWHILNDTNQPFSRAGQVAAVSFFTEMAKKYKGHNNVLYEICNEPTAANGGSWTNIRNYANVVITAIRKIDKDAIIIVGTPTWSQDVDEAARSPLSGSNLVYTLHFYAGTHKDSYRQKAETAIKAGLPIFVSEFGISDASGNGYLDTAEGDRWISFLNQYGIGYVAWNLSNKSESSALIKSSTSKTFGWAWSDLTQSGQWLVKKFGGKLAKTASSGTAGGKDNVSPGTTDGKKPSTQGTNGKDKDNTSGKDETGSGQKTPGKSSKSVRASSKYAKAKVKKVASWPTGQGYCTQYVLTIRNKSKKTISGWKIRVKFAYAIEENTQWSAIYKFKKKSIIIRPSFNKEIAPKSSITNIGFIVSSARANNKVVSVKFLKKG